MSINLVVRRRRVERFTMVPNDVVAMLATGELSANAFAALVVVMSKPDGWDWSAPAIAAASGIGRDAWQAARRLLLKCGAISEVRRPRLVNGRVCGSVFEVDWPPVNRETEKPAPGETGHREPGFPVAGKAGSPEPGNPVPFLRQTPADAAAADAAKRRRPPGKASAKLRGPDGLAPAVELVETPPGPAVEPVRRPSADAPGRRAKPDIGGEFLRSRGVAWPVKQDALNKASVAAVSLSADG